MNRRSFIKVVSGIAIASSAFVIYDYLEAPQAREKLSHIKSVISEGDIGFSIKCAVASGGTEFINGVLNKKYFRTLYGQIDVLGYLVDENEFNHFSSWLKQQLR